MAKKGKYEELAVQVMELIGGTDNVSYFTHCVTRLRFNLKDQSVVDLEAIKKVDGVIGCQWSNGQLQIIIGQTVGDAYDAICRKTGLGEPAKGRPAAAKEKKKFTPGMLLDGITGCLAPLIPLVIGAGMLKVVILLLEMAGILPADGNTYRIFTAVSDAGFYFLPVFLGATAAKKFGANQGLGMLMGAVLIHPDFIAALGSGTALTLLGVPVYAASYTHSIFPVILTVFVMSHIERFIAKHSPDSLRSILEPLLTILVMVPLSVCVLSPAGAFAGEYFARLMMWLYDKVGFIGIGVLSAIMPFVIMTGMHMALNPGAFQMLATVGYDPIVMPCMVLSNMNQGSACLAVALKTKNREVRSLALSCAITVILGGVSEPALYGITMKYKKPLYSAMIGSFCGGCVAAFMGAHAYAFASMSIFCLPAFVGEGVFTALTGIAAGIVVSMTVTFAAAMFLVKPEDVG